MEGVIISIAICCILPIASVFIVFFYTEKIMANKMNLLSKAIDSGVNIDPQGLMESLESKKKKNRTIKERLINKLIWGIILFILGASAFVCTAFNLNIPEALFIYPGIAGTAVGTALIVSYFVGKKLLSSEIEAETKMFAEKSCKALK